MSADVCPSDPALSEFFHHLRVEPVLPDALDLPSVRRVGLFLIFLILHPGRFQNFRNIQIIRTVHNALERLKADLPG